MQNSSTYRSTSAFGSQGVPGGLNHRSFGMPSRSLTPLANRAALRDATLDPNDEDENAPPDPSKGLEDQIPTDGWGAKSHMVGAFGRKSTLSSTPARTPVRESQPPNGLTGSTMAGSVFAGSTTGTPTGGSRIVFRVDPTMASTFDKKTEPELYELWASK
ncbi:hypothetical protein FRC14_003466 [Serendipita sp. 396]|nr:hypothetical protein FRC14_003466 [Serendipita sp. 396]KAG8787599.1 hypothetical protein FRC15_008848 [Serendipita sp. 397]KAG8803339.1 hypothetical protein FRC16_006084 [Serendipita sp. 398]KAG8876223.1 hypothetical protein FRC20_002195 [Serendipita sp. 405]